MTKKEIALKIVNICRNDASFCKDIEGGDPNIFLSEISDKMDEKDFLFSVDKYLATFKVLGHLYFYKKGTGNIGFHVRGYKDTLFVTDSEEQIPLIKGDEIIAVNGLSILQAADKFNVFLGEATDRNGYGWEKIISYADEITVKRDEKTLNYAIQTNIKKTEKYPYEYKRLNRDCSYIRLENFFDEIAFEKFIEDCKDELDRSDYLIIDVRNNCGGSDTVFLPLLKYCLKENDFMCGKPIFSSDEEILCTENNVENRIKLYKSYLKRTTSLELRRYLIDQISEQTKNKGKGFVSAKADDFLFPYHGTLLPKKIVVLTDYNCGSSGESFVETISKLEKVTVVGRPTMGICDYSNLAYYDFGEYVLHYPTSRSRKIDEGKGMRGHGLQPDIMIPWSPIHLKEDIDVAAAIEFLNGNISDSL